jgi:(p)ppGpp synthase/HD superfamily hydrolase
MDITGVPKGFQSRIQVQIRTKGLDAQNAGRLANHEAYKVFSGNDLLSKIEADPNKYLDQLYQIVHNLRCAYGLLQQENTHTPAAILENYGIDFGGPMSIVRTGRLY